MCKEYNMVAFDCGNSTIRTILCHFDGERISSEIIKSDPNEMVKIGDYYYWDMLNIFTNMKKGLESAAKRVGRIHSAGVCTWGIDMMFLDERDTMLGNVLSYRNTIGAEEMQSLSEEELNGMFYRTGILADKINTVFMLRGLRKKLPTITENGRKILMVPDILTWFFTGAKINEPSELSTTQLMDVRTKKISIEQCRATGLNPDWFCEMGDHGKLIGNIRRDILDELLIGYDIPMVCVPSHDTASAVLAIPCEDDEYLFVSSGTWALIGAQCREPIINEEVLKNKLTNEMGAFGYITLLKNTTGMFITQRLKKEYEKENGSICWDDFFAMGRALPAPPPTFDVNDPLFFNPPHMAAAIWQRNHPESGGKDYKWPEVLASVEESLAVSYVTGLKAVMECTKKSYSSVNVVGGGAKNDAINQKCANKLGLPVMACTQECSSIGNCAAQLAYLEPDISYAELRGVIAASLITKTYFPG
ncbi:MAG: FGGY family carbohydrate kinase [Oscillospiraceae bacterium]|nr:FGGY family carbohydrate kinase [Oscillospiraceae bacterium]